MNINSIQQQPTTFKSKVNRGYEAVSYLKVTKSKVPIKTQIKELENNGINDLVYIDLVKNNNINKLIMHVIRDAGRTGYKGTVELILEKPSTPINLKAMYKEATMNMNTKVSNYRELSDIS